MKILVDKELLERLFTAFDSEGENPDWAMDELRTLLAHPSQQQEPVCEIAMSDGGYKIGLLGNLRYRRLPIGTKLYTHPAPADTRLVEALEHIRGLQAHCDVWDIIDAALAGTP
jgi:hypothetical protein